jgi:FkbM family methyltransferase
MLLGRYEAHVVKGLLSMRSPVTIAYDVGSHVGFLTLVLAKVVGGDGQVFCFEPIPENYRLIEKLVVVNGLDPVVRVIPYALGNAVRQEKMIVFETSLMSILKSALDGQNTSNCPVVKVSTLTLDTFVLDRLNPPPDLIKIDVEGAEAQVLQGGLRTLEAYSPKLLTEIHGPRNAKKMWRLLEDLNYSWCRLTSKGQEGVLSEQKLLSFFSKDSWTHHFFLTRNKKTCCS